MKNFTMLAIGLVGLFSVSGNALADFNGNWTGSQGTASGAVNATCGKVIEGISQSATSIVVITNSFACGGFSVQTHTYSFDISGDELIYNGQSVGKISADAFNYTLSGGGAEDAVTFTMNGAALDYKEVISINGLDINVTSTLDK